MKFFFLCDVFLDASSLCVIIDTKSLFLISYGVLLWGALDSNYTTIDSYLKPSLMLQTSNLEKLGFQKPSKDYFSEFFGFVHWFAKSQAIQKFARSSNEIGVNWNWNKLVAKTRRKKNKLQQRMPPRRKGYTTVWRFGLCGHMPSWTTSTS